ncbi:unnamed protein product [Caenorhabditis sp. 36 PRJEB53466]|nr:unnamed protein product [Caenorhabditis sp. 36 PRJEB53466]
MAVMTDNCRRVKKSPPIVKNMPVTDSTINGDGLAGNTLVISGDNSEVLACATVIIPGKELMHASFHEEPIEGHVHIIPIKNNAVRLVPDLKYMAKFDYVEPEKKIMTWAFVDSCENAKDSVKHSDYSEVGVDSRATFVYTLPDNCTLAALALLREEKLFACADIVNVEPRTLKSLDVTLRQNHYFEPVIGLKSPPKELHIRDDCLDISTEIVHKSYLSYYPSVNIFGSESIMLKSLVLRGSCSALRPQFARPAAIANFIHPIIGRIALVDTDDKILLTGEVRNIFDEMATRATVMISNKTAESTSCIHTTCESCHIVEDAAVVVGKNEAAVTMTGVFNWFNISEMRSAIIDLEWIKVCANLTILPSGALTMHAMVKRLAPFSSSTVASVVALEYPANNYTEILINKKQKFSDVQAHFRPLDRSITTGPPCGEQNLGGVTKVTWIDDLKKNLISAENDSSVIFDENLVSGAASMLGTSILLKEGKDVFCGHFEPPSERTVAFAEFGHPFDGYIKMTQYASSNWESGFPTEVYYSLKYKNQSDPEVNPESVLWEIVSDQNLTCSTAVLFNPLQVNESECTSERYEFCPIGSAANRSKPLLMHARWHLTAQSFPLSGPYSVIGKTLRLRSIKNRNQIGCYKVKKVSEATFRWVVYTNTSLSTVQQRISKRTGVPIYKIEVDYTRELYMTRCTIFRITILEEDEKLEQILDSFDVGARKFNNDTELVCGGTEVIPNESSDAISQNIITTSFSTHFALKSLLLIPLVLYYLWLFWLFLSLFYTFATAQNSSCAGTTLLNATREVQYLTTPNYESSHKYPPFLDCKFVIKAPDKTRLVIEIIDMEMEPRIFDECADFIKITDDKESERNSTKVTILCENLKNQQIISSWNNLVISFQSDELVEYRGARISYRFHDLTTCPPGWTEISDENCVRFESDQKVDWIRAQTRCLEQQSNLVLIDSSAKTAELDGLIESVPSKLWIGYTDSASEGVLTSVANKEATVLPNRNPSTLKDNNDDNDCMTFQFGDNSPYRLDSCASYHGYICEMKKDGTSVLYDPPIESIRDGSYSQDYSFTYLLLFLIGLLFLAIILCLCYMCWKQKIDARIHTESSTQQYAFVTDASQHVEQARTSTTGGSPTDVTMPTNSTEARVVRDARNSPVPIPAENNRQPKRFPMAPVPNRLPVAEHNSETEHIMETSIMAAGGLAHQGDESVSAAPKPQPRTLPPMPTREGTFQSINTRDGSTMRTRRNNQLFERPVMHVLDNVSAISLDEFWSNKKS